MDNFLTAAPPSLTYESRSEQSQSPDSSRDFQHILNTEWSSWGMRDEDIAFDVESLFSMELPTIAIDKSPIVDHIVGAQSISPIKSTNEQSDTTQEFSPTFVDGSTFDLEIAHIMDPNSLTTKSKRKHSESSDEEITDRSCSSETVSLKLPDHEATVLKKRPSTGTRPPKISHNVIEKRYRSNLNDKILDLRDAVPSLRHESENSSTKHPKGKIISQATEYIKEIEAKNERLQKEINRLTAKLHNEPTTRTSQTMSRVVVGGLAGMMCATGLQADMAPEAHHKRGLEEIAIPESFASIGSTILVIVKMILLVSGILYVISPDIFLVKITNSPTKQERYSQSSLDDCLQEDVQENRQAIHDNMAAMLEMPCDRPGLFKRILQGCFVLCLEIMIGQNGWNALINRGLDYAQTRRRACRMLIETQLLGGDKCINQAKLFLSAIQSLGYKMPKEMRAIHFAMVCHGYAPTSLIHWCVSLFWSTSSEDSPVLKLPLDQLLSKRVLQAIWAWTTGIEDPLIANVRSDETIDTPLKQLSSIHAAILQNYILREWLRGVTSTSELDSKISTLLLYSPAESRIMTNSLYLRSMIEPNDWLEKAMLKSILNDDDCAKGTKTSVHEVAMQLRCCVLLNLLEKNPKSEEVSDVLQMAEVETNSLLPGYSSRIVASCITKHRLDDEDGISEALRRICAKIGGTMRVDM